MTHQGKVVAALFLAALSACATAHYRNSIHPGYGDAEYNADLTQCRKENSHTETTQGYDVQIRVVVDEAKADACMKARGWSQAGR